MSKRRRRQPLRGMWLTWLAIFLVCAGIVCEFLWLFFDANTLLFAGGAFVVAGVLCMAASSTLYD